MTLQELYQSIGGDYEQALRVLRMDKLLDKHIRKLTNNGVVDALIEAGGSMEPERMFETAHAVKGVCGNLGLVTLSSAASEIAEEFRPGNQRQHSDAWISEKLDEISELYEKMKTGIAQYVGE